jgi:DmsE family decaheme c-type cytochrome
MRRILVFCTFTFLVCLVMYQHPAVFAASGHSGTQNNHVQTQAAETLPGGYVGSQMCATCHAEVAHSFADNPHAKMVMMHGDKGLSCENCHGPGEAHVAGGGDVTKIFRFDKASAQQVNARCLSCHAGAHPNFERSPHARAGLSCISCHSVHHSATPKFLLTAAQPQLCESCHTDVKAQFAMPFHHPVPEGAVKCTDCHDPHGTFQNAQLRSTADQNKICTQCHSDVRGPFVFEHPAVKAVGCLGCHSPHGSENARLLNMPAVNTLCNQCHSPVAGDTFHSMGAGSSEITPCTNCHTMIHGSNVNAAFIR